MVYIEEYTEIKKTCEKMTKEKARSYEHAIDIVKAGGVDG